MREAQQEKQAGEAVRSSVDFVLVEDKNREKEEKEKGSKVDIVLVPKDNEKFQIREAERINEEKELTKPAWSILKFGFGALAVGEALALIGASAYAAPVIIAGVAGITVGSFLVTLWERDKIVEKIKSAFAYFSSKIKELNKPTVRATLSGFVGSLLSIDGVIRFISSVSLIPKLEIVAGVLALLYAAKEAGLIEKLESPKSNKEKKLEEEKQLQQPKNGETVWVDKFSDSGIVSTPIGNYPTTKKRLEDEEGVSFGEFIEDEVI